MPNILALFQINQRATIFQELSRMIPYMPLRTTTKHGKADAKFANIPYMKVDYGPQKRLNSKSESVQKNWSRQFCFFL